MLKRAWVRGLVVLAVLASIGVGGSGIAVAGDVSKPVVFAPRAPSPIVIDGELDDWVFAKANAILLDEQAQLTPGYDDPAKWLDWTDLSAIVYIAYDDEYLYVAYDVWDDRVIQNFSGQYIYNGDGPELYLDFNPAAEATTYNENTWQFGFTPGTEAAAPAWVLYGQVAGRVLDSSAVKVAAKRDQYGYVLEAAISLAALGVSIQPGAVIGFDVAVNDVDSDAATETENQIILSGSADGWQNPSVFVPLVFYGDSTVVKAFLKSVVQQ